MAQLAELQALAEHMRPSLKPSQGPTPRAEHIMAAILMTRDASLGARAEPEEQQEDDLGLPPLTATRELPNATSPLPPPTDAENSDVERMIVEPFELLALMPPALTAPASALPAAPSPTMMPLATTTTASAPRVILRSGRAVVTQREKCQN